MEVQVSIELQKALGQQRLGTCDYQTPLLFLRSETLLRLWGILGH